MTKRISNMPENMRVKMAVICRFENPFFDLRHDVANVMEGDTGGLSITWANLARRTKKNLMAKLYDLYLSQDNATQKERAKGMLPLILDVVSTEAEESTEVKAFVLEAGRTDAVWKACADTVILEELQIAQTIYEDPLFYNNDPGADTKAFMESLELMTKKTKWVTDLAHVMVMDSIIQGGYFRIVYRLFDAMRPEGERKYDDYYRTLKECFWPDDPHDIFDLQEERDFVEAFCVVRRKWLLNLASGGVNPVLDKTTYRMDSLLYLVEKDVWDFAFDMPFSIFGKETALTKTLLGYG